MSIRANRCYHEDMTSTNLPVNATRAIVANTPSPLASYLAQFLAMPTASRGLDYNLVRPVMEGALALASLHGFDPAEKVQFKRGLNPPSQLSLLDAVLALANKNQNLEINRKWPSDPDDFGPHLDISMHGEWQGVDVEWAAAALTAAGCNPWNDFELGVDPLPLAITSAIDCGMAGLVNRFLDCPNAPSANDLVGVPFSESSPDYNWTSLASDHAQNRVLEVLVERGARTKDEDILAEAFSNATPLAVEILTTAKMVPGTEKSQRKIQSAWKARSVSLGSEVVQKMQIATFGGVASSMSQSALDVSNLLSVEWGKAPSGSSSQAYDFLGGKGVESLLGQADIKSGPMAGHWSVLAAAAASRLRQGSDDGALGWSISTMLHRHYSDEDRRWVVADCAQPPYKGSLTPALGIEWRKGIVIDGIVALSLFGQRGNSMTRTTQDNLQEQQVLRDISDFGLAAGIENPDRWARDHAQSAALFSLHILKSPKVNATRSLLHAWETALYRNPGMASTIKEETRVDLLLALTAQFTLSSNWSSTIHSKQIKAFQSTATALFPQLGKVSAQLGEEVPGVPLRAALIVHLANPRGAKESFEDRLESILLHRAQMGKKEVETINAWVGSLSLSESQLRAMRATVDQWILDQGTPVAPTTRRGLRL